MDTLPPPCVMHEDEHLLVVHKPPGWNTHAPAPYAGEGLYDWLRHREPRWAELAIVHRLDKETSGVMVFAKSEAACRSLTRQFTAHQVRKRYWLLTDAAPERPEWRVKSVIMRKGEKYCSLPPASGGPVAETHFQVLKKGPPALVEARPLTGRTHQIRVHAAHSGCAVLGDTLYGGQPAARVCLHAAELAFAHPATGEPVVFKAEADFNTSASRLLRRALIAAEETNAFRWVHGAADAQAGRYVDQLGAFLLVQADHPPAPLPAQPAEGVYFKQRRVSVRGCAPEEVAPRLLSGRPAPQPFIVRENGVQYELSFNEGYSVGLFLDQRDNRRRLLTGHVARHFPLPQGPAPWEVLNVFAYTCAFSVCAALGGARTTSVDLSRKYLEWGRRNFRLNGLQPEAHDFIYGDAFDWLRRLGRKGRRFDVVVLDPPTFSQSRAHGVFRAESDYGALMKLALPLVRAGGVVLLSCNAARLAAGKFVEMAGAVAQAAGRRVMQEFFAPQPPDFPVTREEPAHLKTLWLRLA